MDEGHLPESRLQAIEDGARQRGRLGDNVTIELVHEIRRLRTHIAESPGPFDDA